MEERHTRKTKYSAKKIATIVTIVGVLLLLVIIAVAVNNNSNGSIDTSTETAQINDKKAVLASNIKEAEDLASSTHADEVMDMEVVEKLKQAIETVKGMSTSNMDEVNEAMQIIGEAIKAVNQSKSGRADEIAMKAKNPWYGEKQTVGQWEESSKDGFKIRLTLEVYPGVVGGKDYVHPDSDAFGIEGVDANTLIIPVRIIAKNITEGNFKLDLRVRPIPSSFGFYYLSGTTVKDPSKESATWFITATETSYNQQLVVLGYMTIPDYKTPAYPNGRPASDFGKSSYDLHIPFEGVSSTKYVRMDKWFVLVGYGDTLTIREK